MPRVHFVFETRRTHRELEVARRNVREGELPVVAGNHLSISGFMLGSESDHRAHTHRSRLVEDCTHDASRRGRRDALILSLLLRPTRSGRSRTYGKCLSCQRVTVGWYHNLRIREGTPSKKDHGKTPKRIRPRELSDPYYDSFIAAQNKYLSLFRNR